MIHLFHHAVLFSLCVGSSVASSAVPTHCQSDEYSVANAWIGSINANEGGWKNTKEGKLLSLCADKKTEPFAKLSYRYGAPGLVEFEAAAQNQRNSSSLAAQLLLILAKTSFSFQTATTPTMS